MTPQMQAALDAFQTWCKADHAADHPNKIDPSEAEDWHSLSLGFFAAKGLEASECQELARIARYNSHYWC